MKLIQNLIFAAAACALSAGASAVTITGTPVAAPAGEMTHAQRSAEKKQIEADEKTAKADCKKLKGAEASACKKKAEANEKSAEADLKAKK